VAATMLTRTPIGPNATATAIETEASPQMDNCLSEWRDRDFGRQVATTGGPVCLVEVLGRQDWADTAHKVVASMERRKNWRTAAVRVLDGGCRKRGWPNPAARAPLFDLGQGTGFALIWTKKVATPATI
jgi:hypothetical protein